MNNYAANNKKSFMIFLDANGKQVSLFAYYKDCILNEKELLQYK